MGAVRAVVNLFPVYGDFMVKRVFVEHLPDLILPEEYQDDLEGRNLRLQIRYSAKGVEILGDAAQVKELESLLQQLDPEIIEQMLCG
jgi:hypothetical protein